jgi:hypothetical protein
LYALVLRATLGVAYTLKSVVGLNTIKALGMFIFVAVALIYVRVLFLSNIPWVVTHARLVEEMVNAVLLIITAIEDAVKLIILVVREIINLFRTHKHVITTDWAKLHFVTVDQTMAMLSAMGRVCGNVNTGPKATLALARWQLNGPLCPIVRAAWPTNANATTYTMLGWATYTPDPGQMAHSCKADENEEALAFCGALASGFILVEIVLPFILIVVLTMHVIKP